MAVSGPDPSVLVRLSIAGYRNDAILINFAPTSILIISKFLWIHTSQILSLSWQLTTLFDKRKKEYIPSQAMLRPDLSYWSTNNKRK